MPEPSPVAHLVSGTATDLTTATDTAIETARAGIERVKTGGGTAVETLDTYDEAMAALNNLTNLFGLIGRTHPDAAMRDTADARRQSLIEVATGFGADTELYAALAALDLTDQDAGTRYYLDKTLRDFRLQGVDRDDATRTRAKELLDEIVTIGTAFGRNIQSDTRTARVAPSALDGLPADYRRAHPAGDDGLVAITTDYPDMVPMMQYSSDAATREQLWRLFRSRAYPVNVDVLRDLIGRRHDLATLLGYESWAQYITEDKMIGTDKAAADFIAKISDAAADRCAADYAELLERKRVEDPDAERVYPWDTAYLQDRLKSEKLDFDTQAVRPYFEYNAVKAGLMALVERMFGISFHRVDDVPTWHPEVEVHDVVRSDGGGPVGRIYLDMHPRPDKYGHAAMFDMRGGKSTRDRRPEGALVCNLPRPGDEPALLLHSDVTTFFHEFGHLIHFIIGGHQRWAGISGIANEHDFVEAPSQLLEEWTFDAGTLATFATHHRTGQPLPAEYVAKLRAADEFGKGLFVRQQMYYAALSLELYRSDPATLDLVEVDRVAMETHTPYRHVPDTHMYASFGHLQGYSAVYYTYMWSLVIAKDLFTRFAAEGLPAPEASAAYRDAVLAAGGSAPAADLVARFLGRPYTFDAYQAWLDA